MCHYIEWNLFIKFLSKHGYAPGRDGIIINYIKYDLFFNFDWVCIWFFIQLTYLSVHIETAIIGMIMGKKGTCMVFLLFYCLLNFFYNRRLIINNL